MSFSIVAAVAENRIIGNRDKLPWHLPEDLGYFYGVIAGKPVIVGRNTFLSMKGKPVTCSRAIVLTHDPDPAFVGEGCQVVNSCAAILDLKIPQNVEIMVIGGASIYSQFLPFVNKMYLTNIHHDFVGDTYFPKWREDEWNIIGKHERKGEEYSYDFITLARK